jgi:hypothetical protein
MYFAGGVDIVLLITSLAVVVLAVSVLTSRQDCQLDFPQPIIVCGLVHFSVVDSQHRSAFSLVWWHLVMVDEEYGLGPFFSVCYMP